MVEGFGSRASSNVEQNADLGLEDGCKKSATLLRRSICTVTYIQGTTERIEEPSVTVDLSVTAEVVSSQSKGGIRSVHSLGVLLLQAKDDLSRNHTLVGRRKLELHIRRKTHRTGILEHVSLHSFVLNRVFHGTCDGDD